MKKLLNFGYKLQDKEYIKYIHERQYDEIMIIVYEWGLGNEPRYCCCVCTNDNQDNLVEVNNDCDLEWVLALEKLLTTKKLGTVFQNCT